MIRKVASVGVLVFLFVLSMSVTASNGLIGQTDVSLTGNETISTNFVGEDEHLPPEGPAPSAPIGGPNDQ